MKNNQRWDQLLKKINLKVNDIDLLKRAFIHRSYLNEHKNRHLISNEKLEFLGDSVLSLITSVYLYKHYPHLNEGEYTDVRAAIVRTESLAKAAGEIGLGQFLFLSKGEELSQGRNNPHLLADCFEALIATIFIDQGYQKAVEFVRNHLFKDKIAYIIDHKLYLSDKNRLQEYIQSRYGKLPQYRLTTTHGPDHQRVFIITVNVNGKEIGRGEGRSRKRAEEVAAKKALEKMNK